MLVRPSITKQLNIVSTAVIIVQVFQPVCNFRLNKQPVRQQVSPGRSRESNKSVSYSSECCYRQEVQLRILPISVIFVFQPANQTEHCFTFKAAPSNPFPHSLELLFFFQTFMKLLHQLFKQGADRIFPLSISVGFVLLHLFLLPAHLFLPLTVITLHFSIHVFLLLSPCCIPLSLCCRCIILSCSSFENINAQPISAALKHFGSFYLYFLTAQNHIIHTHKFCEHRLKIKSTTCLDLILASICISAHQI